MGNYFIICKLERESNYIRSRDKTHKQCKQDFNSSQRQKECFKSSEEMI